MEDSNFLLELKLGNQNALRFIYKKYGRSLLYLANSIIKNKQASEEIVNDAYLRVWEIRNNFESLAKIKAFLYIITKNACYNYHKKIINQIKFEDIEEQYQLIVQDSNVLELIIKGEVFEKILQEVEKLSDKQQKIFNLIYVEQLSIEEICQKLSLKPNAVYTIKSRILSTIKNNLKKNDLDYELPSMLVLHLILQSLFNL